MVGGSSARTDPSRRAEAASPSADPLDVVAPDGATFMMATVPPPTTTLEPDGSEDGPLFFDDPTKAVPAFTLPCAPKPPVRHEHGGERCGGGA